MKLKNVKISTQLRLGLGAVLLVVVFLTALAWVQTDMLWRQTEGLYNHPLQVRRALGELTADILAMHRGMKDLFLNADDAEIAEVLDGIESRKANADHQIESLYAFYLGPHEDIDHVRDSFAEWNAMRGETIRLLREGRHDEAMARTKKSGVAGGQVEEILSHINDVSNFALKRGDQFYKDATDLNRTLNRRLLLATVAIFLMTGATSLLLLRGIRTPLRDLLAVTEAFRRGNLDARSGYVSANEFGELAASFNAMAETVQTETRLNTREAELAETMLKEDDPHTFCRELLKALMGQTGAQVGAVYLLNRQGTAYEHYESVGLGAQARKSFSREDLEGEFGAALATGKIQHVRDIPPDTQFVFSAVTGDFLPRELLTIPIQDRGTTTALISLAHVGEFSQFSLRLVGDIWDMLSARINGLIAFHQARELAARLEVQNDELEKAAAYNRCLIEASLDPLVTIGPDGAITDVNRATEAVTGRTRSGLVGTDFADYFTEPELARAGYRRVFEEGAVHNYELAIRGAEGRVTPVLYNAAVYRDASGRVIGVFAAARDITEQKRDEERLRALNGELELRSERLEEANIEMEAQRDELAEQNTELEMQKRALDEANRLKSIFLSNMSHELRTPLNSVIALSGVLGRRLDGKIPADETGYLEVIERNGKHLLSLINDILDLSRIEAGREEINPEVVQIREIAADITTMISPQAEEKGIALRNTVGDGLPPIFTDAQKLRHILQNLVGNAVKFTEEGGVTVSARREGDTVFIAVADTGIGIAGDQLPLIFDEFRQADGSASRKYGGTGLGLAIARKYALMLQGGITVESRPGEGSVFTLRLPVTPDPGHGGALLEKRVPAMSAPSVIHGAGRRILLVEDSEPAIVQVTDILTRHGYAVAVARSGREALEKIAEALPDGVILDLMMPEMDGFEVLRVIRETEHCARLPVLILTAKHVTRGELSFLKGNNIHQLIQKGDISREQLLAAVAGMVAPHREDKPHPPETPRRVKRHAGDGPPLALVVEDNPDNLQTMKAVLEGHCRVIEAMDGREGVRLAAERRPDIIFMDIAMPVMDGLQAIKVIRADEALRDIPVLAVTASAMTGDREAILAHGFDGYLSKPMDPTALLDTVKRIL